MSQFGVSWWLTGVALALPIVSYLAAYNKNLPMLWVLSPMLMAVVLTGLILPLWMVRGLHVRRTFREKAVAGERLEVDISVENQGLLPRFMVSVSEKAPTLTDNPAGNIFLGQLPWLAPRSTTSYRAVIDTLRRGQHTLGPAELVSDYPFGFIRVRGFAKDSQRDLLVYPKTYPNVLPPLTGSIRELEQEEFHPPASDGQDTFKTLRDYRPGDPLNRINWKASARQDKLIVVEREPVANAAIHIFLDLNGESNVGLDGHTTTEAAISIAASIAIAATREKVKHRVCGEDFELFDIGPDLSPGHLQHVMDRLAVAKTNGTRDYADLLTGMGRQLVPGDTVVVFLSGGGTTGNARTVGVVGDWMRRKINVCPIVFDRESFNPSASNDNSALTIRYYPVAVGTDLASVFRR